MLCGYAGNKIFSEVQTIEDCTELQTNLDTISNGALVIGFISLLRNMRLLLFQGILKISGKITQSRI